MYLHKIEQETGRIEANFSFSHWSSPLERESKLPRSFQRCLPLQRWQGVLCTQQGETGASSLPSSSPTTHQQHQCCSAFEAAPGEAVLFLCCVNLPWPWHWDCSQPVLHRGASSRAAGMHPAHPLQSLAGTSWAAKPIRTECSWDQGVGCEIQSHFTIIHILQSFQKLKILIFSFYFTNPLLFFFFYFFKCPLDLPLHFSPCVVNSEFQGV